MITRAFATTLLMLASAAWAAEPLELQTQYEKAATITGDGTARIVVYSDRAGTAQAQAWGDALGESSCPVVAAANLSGVPELAQAMVAEGFEGEDSVALDWGGRVAQRFGFTPEVANVYLLDAQGRRTMHMIGAPSSQKLDRLNSAGRARCADGGQ